MTKKIDKPDVDAVLPEDISAEMPSSQPTPDAPPAPATSATAAWKTETVKFHSVGVWRVILTDAVGYPGRYTVDFLNGVTTQTDVQVIAALRTLQKRGGSVREIK